jgi:hypothetical protein
VRIRVLHRVGGVQSGGSIGLILTTFLMFLLSAAGCSNLTGWNIPGTEKSAMPTTKVYLVLENVEAVPEEVRPAGEIYVDDAFFGYTSRPVFSKFVGNALVVGKIQIEKEKVHTVKVLYPDYEPFEHTRYFGTLQEYSISFRLKRLADEPVAPPPAEAEAEEEDQRKWYEFWRWFDGSGSDSEAPE